MSDAYSQLKPLHHTHRLELLKYNRVPNPVHVQLILSDLCNQDCHFCAYRMSGGLSTELFGTATTHNPNRKMDTDKAQQIITDCAAMGVKAIQFTGGGEPTVHKDCFGLIAYAQQLGLDTALVTNGVKLDPEHPAVQRLKWLRISVDAGCADTYMKVRRVTQAHWDKVWNNIAALRDFKGHFGIGFVVTNENFEELSMCALKCDAFGVPYMRVGAVFSELGLDFYDDINAIHAAIEDAKELETGYFKIVDLFGRRLSDLEFGQPDFDFCGYQYFTTYIGADLNVYRCCNTAYTKAGTLGSLKNQRFLGAKLALAPFDATSCRFCQFLGQNRAINAMLSEPDDINFV